MDIDPLRMRATAERGDTAIASPQIRIGRFAPYPVWMALRWICSIGVAMALGWFASAIYALFSAIDGGDASPWPIWIGIVGCLIGASSRGYRGNLPPFGELVGGILASKQCPACGQSIFDHTPPSGYQPDLVKQSWWPSRHCTNCGHDMARRTAQ